ncbi:hypothetical protein [Nocardia sp. NPDC048505]|uniref:hypothetical protein n=1 Tax=unclassified Nocardia TaxID=2637762 RepID=UPI003401A998
MTVLAHGLGGADDLPIPLSYALIGAAWALTFSFAILLLAWREPRLDPESPGRRLPAFLDAAPLRRAIDLTTIAGAVLLGLILVLGSPDPQRNPAPGVFYIYLWVGVTTASLVFGPVWKLLSPLRAAHRLVCLLLRRDPRTGPLAYPESWGYRPAVLGLFAFAWLELAAPEPDSLTAIGIWLLAYVLSTGAGLALFGSVWAERADPFEVYSTLLARVSWFGRDGSGHPVLRAPLNNLAAGPVLPGAVALAATLLGATAFDSLSALPAWREFLDSRSGGEVLTATVTRTLGLLTVIAIVGVLFVRAARAVPGLERAERARLPRLLVHSLTPIIAGYLIAHYLTLLVEKGQATLALLADPFDRGWNIAGLADHQVAYVLSTHPAVLATLKVLAVLTGHILGVTAAHDRCLTLLPRAHRATGQLALMLVMVGFTFTGLYLLFGG